MSLNVVPSGACSAAAKSKVAELVENKFASRLFAKDFTLWGKAAESESSIRLGWTSSATDSAALVDGIIALRDEFSAEGVNRVVLCGMGGSSLAPEVICGTAGVDLVVLDSTNPEQVGKALAGDLAKTVVVVSSKSGSTVETDSQKRLFEEAFTKAGISKTDRIVIVTDPGSPMEAAAKEDGYRIFNADPSVGGRYSALTAFGLVPSGLAGVDIASLLEEASSAAEILRQDSQNNPGLVLGAVMAATVQNGSKADKLAILDVDSPLVGFGDWAEQLIAESTGKDGVGVLPLVVDKTAPELSKLPSDVILAKIVKNAVTSESDEVQVSGSLGEQFLLWEVATTVASAILGINPFDQPDVESAKIAARGMLENRAVLSPADAVISGIELRAKNLSLSSNTNLEDAFVSLFETLANDGYVSIQAYLDRIGKPEFSKLRNLIAEKSGRPTTFGWAPRFLHSTGQYHKGGPAQGVYLQLVSKAQHDIQVPGRDFTLGELIASQAAGDANVLAEHGRPVLTLTFDSAKDVLQIIENSLGA